ncbi:MAG: glycosyltransferase [Crocinitomicaceae bacterium]|nr:glycosyltransferase [Crocinitomicaceae bacterium]
MTSETIKIAVIIPWSVDRDSRARRSIKEMAKYGIVDVFYLPYSQEDKSIDWKYSSNIFFHPLEKPKDNLYSRLIENSFFYLKHSYFISYVLSKKIDYDIIYIHDLISGHIGISLKKALKCKLIYDVHDLYIETLNQQFPVSENGKMKFKHYLMYKIMVFLGKKLEHKVVDKSEIVFTVNHSCMEYLQTKYQSNKILYFRNFPEYRNLPKQNNNLAEKTLSNPDINFAVYIGSIARGRQLKNIVNSAPYLNENNVIVIIGDGVIKSELIKIAEANKTINNKIFFLSSLPYDSLFETIIQAKLGLMMLDPINKSKEYALANKISEYMLCGITPLLSNHIEHRKLIEENDVCFLINSYEPTVIAQRINEIFLEPKILDKKSANSRKAFEKKYNWEIEKQSFTLPFEKLLIK